MGSPSYSFIAGDRGSWEVVSVSPVVGETLEPVPFMDVRNEYVMNLPVDFRWLLRGVTGSRRQVDSVRQSSVMSAQPQLGRRKATCAALIPVRKKQAWWDMAHEERCRLCEAKSRGAISEVEYLPDVARKLHHCRDLNEPFDYLAWFEYAPEQSSEFEKLVAALRKNEDWKFVEREVDVRLVRSNSSAFEF